MKYCKKCGVELEDDVLFCHQCGASQNESQAEKKEEKPIRGSIIGFVLSFVLGLIGFLLCYFLGDEDCKKTATKTYIICLLVKVSLTVLYIIFSIILTGALTGLAL